jgi:hypothetical protein
MEKSLVKENFSGNKAGQESPRFALKSNSAKSPFPKKEPLSKGLSYIFSFYAKQQKLVKGGSTFEDYHEDSTTLSIGEFLVFCRDFKIYSKEKLGKKELIELFRVNCSFRKEMTEAEFQLVLQHLSNKLFNEGPKENYQKLLNFLQVEDLDSVKRICKGFTQPFFSDKKKPRSPALRIKLPSDKNLPRVSSIIMPRFKSTKNLKKNRKEALVPCDAVITTFKKTGYAGLLQRASNLTCTWQTLSSLSAEQVAESNKIFELIPENDDSEDEMLNKMYGSLKNTSKSNK